MENFERFMPFPYDRHDGKGFARNDEVDIEKVKHHYEDQTNGYSIFEEIEELVPRRRRLDDNRNFR